MAAAAIAGTLFQAGNSLSSKATPKSSRASTDSWGTAQRLDVETHLVEQCLAGEQSAWEELIQTHSRRVYAICYRFTNRDNESQDLTQEVFLRVFRTLASFRSGEGCFTVWLTRLTRNLLVDHYRAIEQDSKSAFAEKIASLEANLASPPPG